MEYYSLNYMINSIEAKVDYYEQSFPGETDRYFGSILKYLRELKEVTK